MSTTGKATDFVRQKTVGEIIIGGCNDLARKRGTESTGKPLSQDKGVKLRFYGYVTQLD